MPHRGAGGWALLGRNFHPLCNLSLQIAYIHPHEFDGDEEPPYYFIMRELAAALLLVPLSDPVYLRPGFRGDVDRGLLRIAARFFYRYDLVNAGFR